MSVLLLMGCEDNGSSGQQSAGQASYTDVSAGSFAADTNAPGYGIDAGAPTNLPQPLSQQELNDFASQFTSNYQHYFE